MREYTAKTLIQTYRWARLHPTGIIPIDRMEQLTGEEWLRWFRKCLHIKCSRGLSQYGRKWEPDWFWLMYRTSRDINSRVAIHCLPKELLPRLQHRLFQE